MKRFVAIGMMLAASSCAKSHSNTASQKSESSAEQKQPIALSREDAQILADALGVTATESSTSDKLFYPVAAALTMNVEAKLDAQKKVDIIGELTFDFANVHPELEDDLEKSNEEIKYSFSNNAGGLYEFLKGPEKKWTNANIDVYTYKKVEGKKFLIMCAKYVSNGKYRCIVTVNVAKN